ncbi:MAG TPA: hypothetical protein VF158_07955 [Longimicrobiales bacterium]
MSGGDAERGDPRHSAMTGSAGGDRGADAGLDPRVLAAAVRDACVQTAIEAFDDAGVRGLCGEGALEYALDAIRRLDLDAVVSAARRAADGSANAAG